MNEEGRYDLPTLQDMPRFEKDDQKPTNDHHDTGNQRPFQSRHVRLPIHAGLPIYPAITLTSSANRVYDSGYL